MLASDESLVTVNKRVNDSASSWSLDRHHLALLFTKSPSDGRLMTTANFGERTGTCLRNETSDQEFKFVEFHANVARRIAVATVRIGY